MAGVKVSITIQDDGFREALTRLLDRTANLKPVFDEIGSALLATTEQRFESESGPDGAPWAAHSTATLLRRGSNARKLRDRGHLYQSLTYASGRLKAEVGTNRIYARIHQLGGKAGRGRKGTIPARPYLGVSAEDRRMIGEILTDHLAMAVRR